MGFPATEKGLAGGIELPVSFLGVLHLGLVDSRRVGQVIFAVLTGDNLTRRIDGHARQDWSSRYRM